MTLRSAWTWFAAWGVGAGLLWPALFLPVWAPVKILAYLLTPVILCGGLGLVQYVIWTYRDDMEKAWPILFMIPLVYIAQPLWMAPMFALFNLISMLTTR